MHHSIHRLAALAVGLAATVAAMAYSVRGTVAETGTLEPLIQASVRLLAARDSAVVKPLSVISTVVLPSTASKPAAIFSKPPMWAILRNTAT